MFELIRPDTHIDFIGRRRLWAAISVSLIIVSLVAIPFRGIRLGIDFAGGSEVQLRFAPGVAADEGKIRTLINGLEGMGDASVIRFGEADKNEFLIKVAGSIEKAEGPEGVPAPPAGDQPAESDRVIQLQKLLAEGIGPVSVERVEFVGPRVGRELQRDGLMALGLACLFILIYIAFRFSARFAPGAVIALVHDVVITSGVFVVLGLEFDLSILAALLAILGYSLNDTIIVYDRVRENLELHTKADLPEVLNLSVNQTLSRTILTSGTTLLALVCLLFLGGPVIWPFAFAMTIGVVVGTYSSIYIAAPTLLLLEQRYGGAGAPSERGGASRPRPAAREAGKAARPQGSSGSRGPKGGGKRGRSGKRSRAARG